MSRSLLRRPSPTTLLARLIELPNLVRTVRALPTQAFSALVRQVGVEDAGEIIALATTDQLVAAFDEDLFTNSNPGQRERFNTGRFIVWLQVLLEAGEDVAANRVLELSDAFQIQAISSVALVLDYDALRVRMSEGGRAAVYADKALESALSEEIDGYLLVSRVPDGWDAVLALVLAMDRDHRSCLERILDRCSAMASEYIEDLDELTAVLSSEDSLAEDVEAEREVRRSRLGYVEPRAARSFLALARRPLATEVASEPRDAITSAYFREVQWRASKAHETPLRSALPQGLGGEAEGSPLLSLSSDTCDPVDPSDASTPFVEGMQLLHSEVPLRFDERMEEFAYLANTLVVGAEVQERRMRSAEAAEAVLATVALGAELEARERRSGRAPTTSPRATAVELCHVLKDCAVDRLFRKASSTLAMEGTSSASDGFVRSRAELGGVIDGCFAES